MRILALSDIHNNVACVRKLRTQEANEFDAIAIAGDIGGHRATEIFEVLKTFGCPIVYVYGDWDGELAYCDNFGPDCHLIHLNIVQVGVLAFAGFSEFRRGRDPRMEPIPESITETRYVQRYRDALADLVLSSGADLRRTIVLTHERTTRLGDRLPELLLYMFGHIHTFNVSDHKGSKYLNVAALDRILPVLPVDVRREVGGLDAEEIYYAFGCSLRYVNAGNYVVIKIDRSGNVRVECRFLNHAYDGWFIVPGHGVFAGPLVPEEAVFGGNERFTRG